MISHFLPSLFVVLVVMGAFLSYINGFIKYAYFVILFLYLFIIAIESFTKRPAKKILPVFLGIIVTHFTYGLGFLQGIITTSSMQIKKE